VKEWSDPEHVIERAACAANLPQSYVVAFLTSNRVNLLDQDTTILEEIGWPVDLIRAAAERQYHTLISAADHVMPS